VRIRGPATLPEVEPIVPMLHEHSFDDPAYFFEPKFDGFRGLLYLGGLEARFRSKRGNVLGRFDELAHWIRQGLGRPEVILDGEVVAIDSQGWQSFRDLMAGRGHRHYAAFDILWLDGKDLRSLPLTRRRQHLERLIPATSPILSRVYAVERRGRELFRAAERLDLEGIVAKRKADPYAPDTIWLKVKNRAYTQMEGRGELFHAPLGRHQTGPHGL
jgi:bifunctional non-homologous end joining protein LigD